MTAHALLTINTRWFKYDRDWFVCTFVQISPGHIWTTLYIHKYNSMLRITAHKSYYTWADQLIPGLNFCEW